MNSPERFSSRASLISFGLSAISIAFALFVGLGGLTGLVVEASNVSSEQFEFQLREKNGSGVEGVVRLSESDVDTRIEVEVTGPEASYLPYLHRGTCDEFIPDVAIPLALVRPGKPSTTTVDLTLSDLINGKFVVDLHVASGSLESLMDPETSVACGQLVPAGSSDQDLQPPVAGIGPFDDGSSRLVVVALTALGAGFAVAGLKMSRISNSIELEEVNPVALQRLRGLFV